MELRRDDLCLDEDKEKKEENQYHKENTFASRLNIRLF